MVLHLWWSECSTTDAVDDGQLTDSLCAMLSVGVIRAVMEVLLCYIVDIFFVYQVEDPPGTFILFPGSFVVYHEHSRSSVSNHSGDPVFVS